MYWKTSKTLRFIVLNRLISLLLDKVLMSREKKDGWHLLESTMENPQPENATCPSSKHWPIQCPCIEAHKAAKMDLVDALILCLPLQWQSITGIRRSRNSSTSRTTGLEFGL